MRRLITFVTSVGILQKPDGVESYALRPGGELAEVTDTPNFENFADLNRHLLAT